MTKKYGRQSYNSFEISVFPSQKNSSGPEIYFMLARSKRHEVNIVIDSNHPIKTGKSQQKMDRISALSRSNRKSEFKSGGHTRHYECTSVGIRQRDYYLLDSAVKTEEFTEQ